MELKTTSEFTFRKWDSKAKLSGELLKRYEQNPTATDLEVRATLGIPNDRYYAVTTFPEQMAGNVRLTGERLVKAHKISKSDAK